MNLGDEKGKNKGKMEVEEEMKWNQRHDPIEN